MPLALIKPVRQSSQNGMAGGKVAPSRLGVDARVRMLLCLALQCCLGHKKKGFQPSQSIV